MRDETFRGIDEPFARLFFCLSFVRCLLRWMPAEETWQDVQLCYQFLSVRSKAWDHVLSKRGNDEKIEKIEYEFNNIYARYPIRAGVSSVSF